MTTYKINEFEVPLYPLRYLKSIFGGSRSGILQKEHRHHLPSPNFRDERSQRLYSIEDLAIIEYTYKEVFPYRQGLKVPDFVKEMIKDALDTSKRVVIKSGRSQGPEDWSELHKKYPQFDKYRLQIYIDVWRRRLLDCNEFFPELVDQDD